MSTMRISDSEFPHPERSFTYISHIFLKISLSVLIVCKAIGSFLVMPAHIHNNYANLSLVNHSEVFYLVVAVYFISLNTDYCQILQKENVCID